MAMTEEEKKFSRSKSLKKYDKKTNTFAIKYTLKESKEAQRLKRYLESTGQTANSYIKSVIKSDLDGKNFN